MSHSTASRQRPSWVRSIVAVPEPIGITPVRCRPSQCTACLANSVAREQCRSAAETECAVSRRFFGGAPFDGNPDARFVSVGCGWRLDGFERTSSDQRNTHPPDLDPLLHPRPGQHPGQAARRESLGGAGARLRRARPRRRSMPQGPRRSVRQHVSHASTRRRSPASPTTWMRCDARRVRSVPPGHRIHRSHVLLSGQAAGRRDRHAAKRAGHVPDQRSDPDGRAGADHKACAGGPGG